MQPVSACYGRIVVTSVTPVRVTCDAVVLTVTLHVSVHGDMIVSMMMVCCMMMLWHVTCDSTRGRECSLWHVTQHEDVS